MQQVEGRPPAEENAEEEREIKEEIEGKREEEGLEPYEPPPAEFEPLERGPESQGCGCPNPPKVGDRVFRVFGGDARGFGRSWSRVDPTTMSNPRNQLGLPSQPGITGYSGGTFNSGGFVAEGEVISLEPGVTVKPATPLHGNSGGAEELFFECPKVQIRIDRVFGVNPPL